MEKDTHNDPQIRKTGQVVTTTLNGTQMKNLIVCKTTLVPNAPWPKIEKPKKIYRQREVGLKKVRISHENTSLDYFLTQLNEIPNRHKVRDNTGRFVKK